MRLVDAIIQILKEAGEPLHIKEITKRIHDSNLFTSNSKTPEATVGVYIYLEVKDHGDESIFVKTDPQTFFLRGVPFVGIPEEDRTYSFLDSAEKVLLRFGKKKPMNYRVIAEKAMELGLLRTGGKTPLVSMHSRMSINSRSKNPRFVRVSPGCYNLIQLVKTGRPKPRS